MIDRAVHSPAGEEPHPSETPLDIANARAVWPLARHPLTSSSQRASFVMPVSMSLQRPHRKDGSSCRGYWHTTFPNASCVVALVDRLINRADIVAIDGESYRLREAEERQKVKVAARKKRKERPPA